MSEFNLYGYDRQGWLNYLYGAYHVKMDRAPNEPRLNYDEWLAQMGKDQLIEFYEEELMRPTPTPTPPTDSA